MSRTTQRAYSHPVEFAIHDRHFRKQKSLPDRLRIAFDPRSAVMGLALFANHRLKDNARAGSKQISDFTGGFSASVAASQMSRWSRAGALGSSISVLKKRRYRRLIHFREWA
jgi:hypothetical protein